jgi:hypothetical protein
VSRREKERERERKGRVEHDWKSWITDLKRVKIGSEAEITKEEEEEELGSNSSNWPEQNFVKNALLAVTKRERENYGNLPVFEN